MKPLHTLHNPRANLFIIPRTRQSIHHPREVRPRSLVIISTFGHLSLKGRSAKITKIKCLERFTSLSHSRSSSCQPSKIVFLSSITLLKSEIWRKHWTDLYFNTLPFLCVVDGKQRLHNFRYCPMVVVGESRQVRCASLVALSLNILLQSFIHVPAID